MPGAFPHKVAFDIDFTDESVVQSDVQVVKNNFADDSDGKMIASKF